MERIFEYLAIRFNTNEECLSIDREKVCDIDPSLSVTVKLYFGFFI